MKKLFLLIIMVLGAVPELFAQGLVRVSLSDNSPVMIAVDGRYYKKHGRSVTVGDLPEGKHRIKIYAYSSSGRRGGGNADLVYEGKIHVEDGVLLDCVADVQSGDITISKGDPNTYAYNTAPPPPPPVNSTGNDVYSNGNNSQPANYPGTISQSEVNRLQKKVNDKLTDTDKLKLMKSSLNTKSLSTEQVSVMMTWLNFEASKVDFAKFAYGQTVDPQNYSSLENSFSYNSSKQELENYIQKNKR
ncbi:MAG TPA: DUF4476 domain-containing protein [Flavipsychrobacter sp.]|nr:DUF4476 domain-containing protein [Flavipsychrobacter sp.]